MSFSLNEIEAMGKRAARGAKLPWGIAEEAGKAARWLAARGYPGAEQLANLLTQNDNLLYAELSPVDVDGVWQASARCLCPLITGAALSDQAAEIAEGREIELGMMAEPLLLAPYAANAAKLTGVAILLCWDDVVVILMPDAIAIEGNPKAIAARSTDSVHCRRVDMPSAPVEPLLLSSTTGRDVDADSWSRLTTFAKRTFAPATEASRLSGAGAASATRIDAQCREVMPP